MIMQGRSPHRSSTSFLANSVMGTESNVADIDLVPMINVVFLLLIFFMVVGVFRTDQDAAVVPPTADVSIELANTEAMDQLSIRTDGSFFYRGEPVAFESLENIFNTADAKESLLVRADAKVAANDVIRVFDLLAAAGFPTVNLQIIKGVESNQQ